MYRFFKEEQPPKHSMCMATLNRIEGTIYYVRLPEYENMEVIMPINELTSRRVRSKKKIFDIGQTKPMVVIDDEGGMITVSIKNANKSYPKIYNLANQFHNMALDIAHLYLEYLNKKGIEYNTKESVYKILDQTSWKFTRSDSIKEDYKEILNNPLLLLKHLSVEKEFVDFARKNIIDRVEKKAGLLDQNMKVMSFASNGNDKLIEFFTNLLDTHKEYSLSVLMTSPPCYKFRFETVNLDKAKEYLETIIEEVTKSKDKSLIFEKMGDPELTKPTAVRLRTVNKHDTDALEKFLKNDLKPLSS